MTILDLARRTKIVATIGPATDSASQITKLVEAGATTFRLNFSHGDHDEHAQRIKTIRQVSDSLGPRLDLVDLKTDLLVSKMAKSLFLHQKILTVISIRPMSLMTN